MRQPANTASGNVAKASVTTIVALGVVNILQPFSQDPYVPSISPIAADFGVSASVIQLSLSFLTFGLMLGMLAAGPLSDAIGRRRPLFLALGLHIFASLLCAMAPVLGVFMLARVLQGVAAAAVTVIGTAMLRDMYDGLRLVRASGQVALVAAGSWFIGPFAGSTLLNFTNWRGISFLLGMVGLGVLLLALKVLPETKPPSARNTKIFAGMGKRFAHVLSDSSYRGFVVANAFITLGVYGYLDSMTLTFHNVFGIEANQVGVFIAINSVGAYGGVQTGAWLSRKLPAQWTIVGSLALAAIAGAAILVLSPLHPSVWVVEPLLFTYTFVFGFGTTPIQALSLQAHGAEAGTAAALLAAVSFLFATLAGPYFTWLDMTTLVGIGGNILIAMVGALVSVVVLVKPWRVKPLV